MPACACKGHTHAKRIIITGNDAGSIHTTQFFFQACLFYTSSRIILYHLYLFVSVLIGCIAMPCLEIDKEQR